MTFSEGILHPMDGLFVMPDVPELQERSYLGSYSGVGIYSNGILEAIVSDAGLTAETVNNQTQLVRLVNILL